MEYAVALLLTIAVETILLLCIFDDKSWKSVVFAGIVANVVSHPLVWTMTSVLGVHFLLTELAAFFIELFLYKKLLKLTYGKAAIVSLLVNLASFAAGLMIISL